MEMPVICPKCDEWVELNSTQESPINKELLCENCYASDQQAFDMVEEIKDIQYMLNNDDPQVKGDRRGWKKNIKDLKIKVKELGYDVENLIL